MNGAEHSFHLRPGRWTEGELPGLRSPGVHRLLPAVAVSGGWTSADEFQADIVFVTSPHRLQLRAKTGEKPTFEADWLIAPLS
jgi:hypothetical protein